MSIGEWLEAYRDSPWSKPMAIGAALLFMAINLLTQSCLFFFSGGFAFGVILIHGINTPRRLAKYGLIIVACSVPLVAVMSAATLAPTDIVISDPNLDPQGIFAPKVDIQWIETTGALTATVVTLGNASGVSEADIKAPLVTRIHVLVKEIEFSLRGMVIATATIETDFVRDATDAYNVTYSLLISLDAGKIYILQLSAYNGERLIGESGIAHLETGMPLIQRTALWMARSSYTLVPIYILYFILVGMLWWIQRYKVVQDAKYEREVAEVREDLKLDEIEAAEAARAELESGSPAEDDPDPDPDSDLDSDLDSEPDLDPDLDPDPDLDVDPADTAGDRVDTGDDGAGEETR